MSNGGGPVPGCPREEGHKLNRSWLSLTRAGVLRVGVVIGVLALVTTAVFGGAPAAASPTTPALKPETGSVKGDVEVDVPYDGARFTSVAAGDGHSVALAEDGTVWAWGYNNHGQLGNGRNTNSYYPVQVQGLESITAIAAGGSHSLALTKDGTVWAWGRNATWQLGSGHWGPYQINYPVKVLLPVGAEGTPQPVTAIAAGERHSLALREDGKVLAWGGNNSGQLGIGDDKEAEEVPVQVQGLESVTAIAAGSSHSLAVVADKDGGTVRAWGNNDFGQLGNNSTTNSNFPVQVEGLKSPTAIAAGSSHSLAVVTDKDGGTVRAWGNNDSGQLGDGTKTDSHVPVPVKQLAAAIAAGGDHSFVVAPDDDGERALWAWGSNYFGVLGNGSGGIGAGSDVPVKVVDLESPTAIVTGTHHAVALTEGGEMSAWGGQPRRAGG